MMMCIKHRDLIEKNVQRIIEVFMKQGMAIGHENKVIGQKVNIRI